MNSHPMIQPSSWDEPPESLTGGVSSQRQALYRVIWDSALACTLKSPTLNHQRSVYRSPAGQALAFATVGVVSSTPGYWRFRQDWPTTAFPESRSDAIGAALSVGTLTVSATNVRPMPGSTVAALLRQMVAKGVTTPSSCASTLKDMLGEGPNTAQRAMQLGSTGSDTGPNQSPQVSLTEKGQELYACWSVAGMLSSNERTNEWIAAVEAQSMSYREALDRVGDGEDMDGSAAYIDAICQRWAGLSRGQLMEGRVLATTRAPRFTGLPTWLDPELSLTPDHPWRQLKLEMEQALALREPSWPAQTVPEQSAAREAWLQAYCDQDGIMAEQLRPHICGPNAGFSTLRYWLTGERAETPEIRHQ